MLPIAIEEQNFSHPFYILDNMNHEVILGVDFLQEHKAMISFEANCLVFQDSTYVPLVCKETARTTVRAVCNVSLPARTQTLLPVQCGNTSAPYGIIEPVPSLYSDEQLLGAKCVVQSRVKRCTKS